MALVLRHLTRSRLGSPFHRCGSRGFGAALETQPGRSRTLLRSLRAPVSCIILGGSATAAVHWYSSTPRTIAPVQVPASGYGSGAALKHLRRQTSWRRLFQVCLTLLPAAFLWPLALMHPPTYWYCVASLLEACGPCFVKLAQWLATRRDLFPDSICEELSRLHEKVAAFWSTGVSIDTIRTRLEDASIRLRSLDQVPHASGSIAEVFFGELEDGTAVALKCLRPDVKTVLEEDLAWLLRLGGWADRQDSLRMLGLRRAAEEFCEQVQMQTDFEIEAAHLRQFQANFADSMESVRFPTPLFASPDVLVLTREGGEELAKVFRAAGHAHATDDLASPAIAGPGAISASAARRTTQEPVPDSEIGDRLQRHSREVREVLGISEAVSGNIGFECMSIYMKMIFRDGFIHGDLHPGNIMLWQRRDQDRRAEATETLSWPERLWNSVRGVGNRGSKPYELVILDAGLAIPVAPEKVEALRSLAISLLYADHRKAAQIIYDMSPDSSRCLSPQQFKDRLAEVFRNCRKNVWEQGFCQVSEACLQSLRLVHDYNVQLDTTFSWVLFSMLTVEGSARQLFPQVDCTDAAARYVITVPSLIRELQGGSAATARQMLIQLICEAWGIDFWYWRRKFASA